MSKRLVVVMAVAVACLLAVVGGLVIVHTQSHKAAPSTAQVDSQVNGALLSLYNDPAFCRDMGKTAPCVPADFHR